MKIVSVCCYNNFNEINETFTLSTTLHEIIDYVNQFLKKHEPNININKIVLKHSELYNIFQVQPNTQLRYLIRNNNKYKICYGGYIKFTVTYNNIEIFPNTKLTSISENNCSLYNNLSFITPFLPSEDIINLKQLNKSFYSFLFINSYLQSSYYICPNTIFFSNNNDNAIINKIPLSSYYTNYNYNILGSFVSKEFIYLLIQSLLTYNVDLLKINKENFSSQEIIFTDEWTYYYMLNNILYQFKSSILKKPTVNKLTGPNNEIKFISIKIMQNDFNIEYYYKYQNNKLFILTKNKMLYSINNKKYKLINICDFSPHYNKFNTLYNNSKVRKYNEYYSFYDEYMFLSLNKFYIINIITGKTVYKESTVRNVNRVEYLGKKYFYIQNYEYVLLISKYTFTVEKCFKRNYTPFVVNCNLLCGNIVFNIIDNNIIQRHLNNKAIVVYKKQFYIKFNSNYYCYNYYNTDKATYIKLISFNNEEKKYSSCNEKVIQLTMDKFVKKIMKSDSYRKEFCYLKENKMKTHLQENMKPKIFFNGFGDVVINIHEYYWFYKHLNNNNDCVNIEKIKCICVKTHLTFEYYNVIFTKNIFYIWSEFSYKVLVFPLEAEKEMFMVNIENFDVNEHDDNQHSPLFIFNENKNDTIYIMCSHLSQRRSMKIYAALLEEDKFIRTEINEEKYLEVFFNINNEDIILWTGFVYEKKYFVIFTNNSLYICKQDLVYKWKYIEICENKYIGNIIKLVKCYIQPLNEEKTMFVMNYYETGKCYLVDINKYIK